MIAVHSLCKRFGAFPVLEDVSLQVGRGEGVVISGPSGSGKTTLLRLLAGLELPDAGEIHIDSVLASSACWRMPPHRRGMGLAFQTCALWPHMTVAENVSFGIEHLPAPERRRRLEELLEQTGLSGLARHYPAQLSGGQARRVSLARALAPCPPILLLDEPFVYLDPEAIRLSLAWIGAEVQRFQTTVIWVTHSLEDLAAVRGRRLRMANGRLLAADGGQP